MFIANAISEQIEQTIKPSNEPTDKNSPTQEYKPTDEQLIIEAIRQSLDS
jgi:hypothetical protein